MSILRRVRDLIEDKTCPGITVYSPITDYGLAQLRKVYKNHCTFKPRWQSYISYLVFNRKVEVTYVLLSYSFHSAFSCVLK